jgi:uncharacterized protein
MQIVWDERKRIANRLKHGFDFSDLSFEYFEQAVIIPAKGSRLKAVGEFGGTLTVVIVQALGSEAISVISMRTANRFERSLHHNAKIKPSTHH